MKMSGAILNSHDPFFNLTIEDYLLHKKTGEYLLLYFNDPSIIAGRHQILYREADVFAAESLGIPVIRRISGGGTVYHDRGNLNFTVIRNSQKGMQVDFALHTRPVIEFLKKEGVPAILSGKSDITVNGLKVSGNAEYVFRERVLHHGTLLFDTSTEIMSRLLRDARDSYSTKAIDSNRVPVMNLKSVLKNISTSDELAFKMFDFMNSYFTGIDDLELSEDEKTEIGLLAGSKYKTWEWNFGYSPAYEFTNTFEAYGATHRISMYVKDGIIWRCTIEGSDLMSVKAKELIGCRHDFKDIINMFRSEKIPVDENEIKKFF